MQTYEVCDRQWQGLCHGQGTGTDCDLQRMWHSTSAGVGPQLDNLRWACRPLCWGRMCVCALFVWAGVQICLPTKTGTRDSCAPLRKSRMKCWNGIHVIQKSQARWNIGQYRQCPAREAMKQPNTDQSAAFSNRNNLKFLAEGAVKTRHQYCLPWKVFTTMINHIYTGGGRKGHRNLWESVESLSWIQAPWRNSLAFHVHLSFSGQVGRKILSSRRSDQSCTLLLPAEALNGGDLPCGICEMFGSTIWDQHGLCWRAATRAVG